MNGNLCKEELQVHGVEASPQPSISRHLSFTKIAINQKLVISMDIKHFLITLLSGIAGTIAMTLVMYLYSSLSNHFTKVIHILGSMISGESNFTNPEKRVLLLGTLAHFGVGIIFSFSYFLLWNWGIFRINFQDAVLIGAASGVLAVIVWKSYLSLHSKPPKISQLHYFIALFLAHIVFGIVSVNVFQLITDNPELWYQLQDKASLRSGLN
ncbi:DUF6789 family protein [Cyclobacterium qasimii]|uniref:Uncharacterized protein n=2 Tax=Cyclobacterium qasimii TaxID=1350429 RepID=S7WYY1_9BACT|nr:DUF6789 family protein [Cyclobacterium qasimii]EPR69133.1 hypothetical protein ADICYQ_1905 [Cyclobacterium qasimii M12-11B]GEO22528.1 hypothetical protein CQA01_30620 [Cyclobacterium qasimii]